MAFGTKAASVAELRKTIDPVYVPNGYAVPFAFYDAFMTANGLYDLIASELAKPDFQDDVQRPGLLKRIRRAIKDAPVPPLMADQLEAMHQAFPEGTTPRCRSSANCEDLVGFSGAGLYDSFTHRLDEGHIAKSIKQVWASLWTHRAYQARDFYRINHRHAAMGVLVHPNYDDEQVNGVALTHNAYFPTSEGYFINAQVGESLVTNPNAGDQPEEVLVLRDANADNIQGYETIYLRRSTLVRDGDAVMPPEDLMLLVTQMKKMHAHFGQIYGRRNNPAFAMDIEFKFDSDGALAIKQTRPWVG